MRQEKSIRKNFILNAVLSMSGVIFPLITFPYVNRILLPEGMGKVTFATSLIAYFSMFAQLGIPTYGIRACAQVRDDRQALTRTVHELLGINLVMDALAYLMLAGALLWIPRLQEARMLYIVVSVSILLESIGTEWLFKALEQYSYITARSLIFKAIALAATFLLIRSESDYILYGGITIFAASASNLLNLINLRRYVDFRRPAGCDWKRHLKPVMIFFAMACATTVYTNLDALMLGFMTTNADVGYYNAAVKVKGVLVGVVTALGAVLLPRSSYYVEQGRMEDFRKMAEKALSFVMLLASLLSLYFILYARECVLILSGDKFLPAVLPMQIITPAVLLIGLTNIMGIQIHVPLGREKTVLISVICGAVTDLALNLALIPGFKAAGAAAGTLAAEIVVLLVQAYYLKAEIREFVRGYNWARTLGALLAASAACMWVKLLKLQPLFAVMLSGSCFFLAGGLFLLWQKEELLTEMWKKLCDRLQK